MIYEISTNGSDQKEILKVLLKRYNNSSCLSVFKKNIEYINMHCIDKKNKSIIKSNILFENNDYLLISRFKSNNKLELMNGEELKEYFDKNGSYLLLKTVTKVLKIFHSNNLYHGGIKLSNIMINEGYNDGEDKYEICDYFFLLLKERELNIYAENKNYISPEEVMGKEIGIEKDMWNIGILLYKILSGKFPFEGDRIFEIFYKIFNVKFDDLEVDFSDSLNPLLHQLLVRESEKRISIVEFKVEIDKIYSTNYIDEVIPFVEEEEREKIVINTDVSNIIKKRCLKINDPVCVFNDHNMYDGKLIALNNEYYIWLYILFSGTYNVKLLSKNNILKKVEKKYIFKKLHNRLIVADMPFRLEFNEEVEFTSEYKHKDISIIEDGKTIINPVEGYGKYPHCYLNVKMSRDIHYFLFKIQHGTSKIYFGCSSNNKYKGNNLYDDESSCSIILWKNYSQLYSSYGNKMKEGDFKNICGKEGEEYELIFNMIEKTMSIKQGNGEEILLFTNIKTPVYPFVCISYKDNSISFIKYWKEYIYVNNSSPERGGFLSWLLPSFFK